MLTLRISFAALMCAFLTLPLARAELVGDIRAGDSKCEVALGRTSPIPFRRATLPYTNQKDQMIKLRSLIGDFDAERDVVVGIRARKHTYLINAHAGRYDPGIFGHRGELHRMKNPRGLRVNPGLVVRLRLTTPLVSAVAREMERSSHLKSWTCTNTVARVLARAGVPGSHAFMLTPRQLLSGLRKASDLNVSYYLVNTDADSVEEFEDGVRVIGPKKPTAEMSEEERRRRAQAGACSDTDSCRGYAPIFFDPEVCLSLSDSGCFGRGGCSESRCDSPDSDSPDCGGSDCNSDTDSNCCN